jgi:multidrug efflux pump subunit AcrA (membrane-fusion protein)
VQVTVSGSGNLEPASELDLGFKAAGTIEHVYAQQGEYVTEGKLLASLDPVPAEVTLQQSRATLQTAEANLSHEEETDGEGSSSVGGGSAGSEATGRTATVAQISTEPAQRNRKPGASKGSGGSSTSEGSGSSSGSGASGAPSPSGGSSHEATNAGTSAGTGSSLSAAAREANIASARAAVKSDRLTVRSDEEALAGTRLYAPQDGTLVSLSGQVGEVVSATGTTRASSSKAGSSESSAGGAGSGRTGGSGSSDGSDSSSGGSAGSSFAVLSDLSSMKLVATLSESEIHRVKVGQIATVTVEALEGRKLAAHVSEVATLPTTTSSGVVGYDVTFHLDQMAAGLKPGMSASGEIVVQQEEGVSVPSSAVADGSVTVLHGAREARQTVTTGLVGDSSTIVTSGLSAGETVVLPQARSTGSSSLSSLLRSRLGGSSGTLGGGGGGVFIGGGGGAFRAGGG